MLPACDRGTRNLEKLLELQLKLLTYLLTYLLYIGQFSLDLYNILSLKC